MTEEDQAMYQARSHEDHLVPSRVPLRREASSNGKQVESYQEMRRIQKQKFDAAKNKHD
jgi:hypothetical protein